MFTFLKNGQLVLVADKTSTGIIGTCLELTVKFRLGIPYSQLSPAGFTDIIWHSKHYDVKQNGSILRYSFSKTYVRGSSRVVYATHCSVKQWDYSATEVATIIDIDDTDFFVVDKREFIEFLADINGMKFNSARNTVNIQTVWNYSKDAPHGKKGALIEAWCYEHEIEDGFKEAVLYGEA